MNQRAEIPIPVVVELPVTPPPSPVSEEERKRREIDPTLALLRQCLAEAGKGGAEEAYTRDRVAEMLDFLERLTGWYQQMSGLPLEAFRKYFQMGGRIRKLRELNK